MSRLSTKPRKASASLGRRLGWMLLAVALGPAVTSPARGGERPESLRPAAASPVKLDEADHTARSHLERIQRYLADGQWDEAIEALRGLMDASGEQLLALSPEPADRRDGFIRFVPLRRYGQWRLAALAEAAPQALEAYRRRVDPLAETWLRQAVAERDARRLRELADRFFVSRSGDDALFRLGEIELERGHFAQARTAWQRLSPQLAMEPSATFVLTYPDTDLEVGEICARLALVSIL